MHLTKEEERVLDGEAGPAAEKSMEMLTSIGDIYGADELVDVESVQVAGVSYRTVGDAGLEYLEDLAGEGAEALVDSKLNPAGMDLHRWREMGVPEEFADKQLRIVDAYRSMGIRPTCTCTPYLTEPPETGSHLAWSESSAVSFVNSVLGARTNREGGPSALAASIVGKTPRYGLHLEEERAPDVKVEVDFEPSGTWEYGELGVAVGEAVEGEVPYFDLKLPSIEEMKSLGAAMASTGSVALYHVEGVTPEADRFEEPDETVHVERAELEGPDTDGVDLVTMGCPHLSEEELHYVADNLEGEVGTPFWLFTSEEIKGRAGSAVERIEEHGAEVFTDTCMVVSPLKEMGYEEVLVNSGKAYTYLPGLGDVEARFGDTDTCLEVATA